MKMRCHFLFTIFCSLLFSVTSIAAEPPATAATNTAPSPVSAPEEAPDKPAAEANTENAARTDSTASMSAPPPYAVRLRRDAEAVLKSEEFHQHDNSTVPVARPWLAKLLKPDGEKVAPKKAPDFSGLAQIMKVMVVAVLLLVLAWLLWRGWQWLSPQLGATAGVRKTGRILEASSLPLPDSALPDSISLAAERAWQGGEHTTALSLLYRGAVQALETHYQLTLPAGATEGEYLRLVRRRGKSELAAGFSTIVSAWMALAYAHRQPAEIDSLLQAYRQHFETAGQAP